MSKNLKLDEHDRLILYQLDLHSRISLSDLSLELKMSRERVDYRLQKLITSGVIRAFTTSINPYKFGLSIYKTYIQLENNKSRVELFVKYLNRHPRVYWYAETTGTWDLMFAIASRNPLEFYAIQSEILSKFSDVVLEFSVYTIVEALFFRKRYLRGIGSDHFLFGGQPDNVTLSRLDFEVLEHLSQNARLSAVELSERVKSSPHIVKRTIQDLESQGIITGYRIELNLERMGMFLYKAQIHLGKYDQRMEKDLFEYCKSNPHVVLFIRQIGECRLELEFEVSGYESVMSHVDDIRGRFAKFIRRIDVVRVNREQYKWMPFTLVGAEEQE